jgi:hypothetical protein
MWSIWVGVLVLVTTWAMVFFLPDTDREPANLHPGTPLRS